MQESAGVFVVQESAMPALRLALEWSIDQRGPSPDSDRLLEVLHRHRGDGLLLGTEEVPLVLVALKAFPSPTAGMLDLTRLLQAPPGK